MRYFYSVDHGRGEFAPAVRPAPMKPQIPRRKRALGVGATITTRAFTLRFDGVQGELFAPQSSKAWTIIKPGHPCHHHQFHAPVYLNKKEVVGTAAAIIKAAQ